MRPGAPIGHNGHGQTYWRIYGQVFIDAWHSQRGVSTSGGNAISHASMINAYSLAPVGVPNRPPYAADGTVFGGKSVVQNASSGSKSLQTLTLPSTLIPSGSRPWLGILCRARTVNTTTNLFGLESAAPASQQHVYILTGTGGVMHLYGQGADRAAGCVMPTTRVFVETYYDGTNAHIVLDGVDLAVAYAGSFGAAATIIRIGNSGGGPCSDLNSAVAFLCSSKPSAAAVAAARALSLAELPA